MTAAIPILFVSNVEASADFFQDKLGFNIDFLHGNPPFYGSVSRDRVRLHLRFVHEPPFAPGVVEREQLLAAFVSVENVWLGCKRRRADWPVCLPEIYWPEAR
jgi:catechol 2,3-dioxygenase-like lactoylglutathione lyase family enzyme